jgi:polyhydroxybutyrate depolymerase
MRRVLRVLLWVAIVVVALAGALFGYFVYTPSPKVPRLSGSLAAGVMEVGGLKRSYLTYLPQALPKGAPLVMAMHGSAGNAAQMRMATGYAFERLADEHGFAVVYPNGFEGYWNACNVVGDYSANKLNVDDVGFAIALVDKLMKDIGIGPSRVFATGISRGGHMAFRLALQAPSRFRAIAAVAANVPTAENFKCNFAGPVTSSVMIMNGTKDPLNPFIGGEVRFFGLLRRGSVRSSRDSGRYFAELNHITGAPQSSEVGAADGVRVERLSWRGDGQLEIEVVAIHGGGHVIPQPYYRYPRLLGPTPSQPNGPAMIWAFFERQRPT